MFTETVAHIPITPMRQQYEMGCVPTSVAMVLSGFGIKTNERRMVQNVFPSAALPLGTPGAGVWDYEIITGLAAVANSKYQLKADAFEPLLWDCKKIPGGPPIIKLEARDFIRQAFSGEFSPSERRYYAALAELTRTGLLGVYTVNGQLIDDLFRSDEPKKYFYSDLAAFIRKGHVMGVTVTRESSHISVVDGTQATDIAFTHMDPSMGSTVLPFGELVSIDMFGARGDLFRRLWRVSSK